MIYTLTLNPAVDYIINLDKFQTGALNRSSGEKVFFGGKGINVSRMLHELGVQSVALGFCAGFTGEAIVGFLNSQKIGNDFVFLRNGLSRINIKLKTDTETEINADGPQISENDISKLFTKLDAVSHGDYLVLSGSVPKSLPENIYEKIIKYLENKKVNFAVDTSGDSLLSALGYKPFLIKPNLFELEQVLNRKINTQQEIVNAASYLHEKGARNVLVSLEGDGATLIDEYEKVHVVTAPLGKVLNSVGAGDSMLAGFICGYDKTHDYDYALKLGTACGSATAFSYDIAKICDVEKLFRA